MYIKEIISGKNPQIFTYSSLIIFLWINTHTHARTHTNVHMYTHIYGKWVLGKIPLKKFPKSKI